MNRFVEILIGIASAVACWFALSFFFFPIELSAPFDVYFKATMTHMVPLKAIITIVFVLLALFLYEQKMKKKKKK